MEILQDLEPKQVFALFEKICSIPHGSQNTTAISNFCVNYAKKHNCPYIKDKADNVIIYVDATKGYENSEPVVLQGHIDMVCEKAPDCTKNLEQDGLDLRTDGEYIWADKTTLGGDDGIAVAYMLALVQSNNIAHPPLELVFTSDEEIGMLGARALDTSVLKGKKLINIDSEEEGILTVSCAGGVRAYCTLNTKSQGADGEFYRIEIKGLIGGHSGVEIHRHRTNASKLLARLLHYIYRNIEFNLVSVHGGTKDNAIPREAEAVVCVDAENSQDFLKAISHFKLLIKKEKSQSEPDLNIKTEKTTSINRCMNNDSTRKVIFALFQIPDGVQSMSPDIPNMVQTSLNLGVLRTENCQVKMNFLVRSNAAAGKQAIVQKLQSFIEYLDDSIEFSADYPAWEYRADSPLRDIMVREYKKYYGNQPEVTAVHAGLECGIFAGKIDDMDAVSFGPDLFNAHTTQEKLGINSARRCWEYLLNILKNCK